MSRYAKINTIKDNILNSNHDIIMLQETWLNENINSDEITGMSNYIALRKNRQYSRRVSWGGGVLTLVRRDVMSKTVHAYSSAEIEIEILYS